MVRVAAHHALSLQSHLLWRVTLPVFRRLVVAALVGLGMQSAAFAQASETQARATAAELSVLVTTAIEVVSALQSDINGGTASGKVAPDTMLDAFAARYVKATGKALDKKGEGFDSDMRKSFVGAVREVFVKFEPAMSKGGTDAFVPAFFRAEVLKRFNVAMKSKVQGYVTNRDSDLINADWSVKQVMKGSPLGSEVSALMSSGAMDTVSKRVGDRVMLYAPMKLGAQCVACHARNNLRQSEGGFGGAFIVEVWLK